MIPASLIPAIIFAAYVVAVCWRHPLGRLYLAVYGAFFVFCLWIVMRIV